LQVYIVGANCLNGATRLWLLDMRLAASLEC